MCMCNQMQSFALKHLLKTEATTFSGRGEEAITRSRKKRVEKTPSPIANSFSQSQCNKNSPEPAWLN